MFPSNNMSKSMVDYMAEMHRLFPRPESENAYSLAAQSPHSSINNHSSSSTDSTSPESYPETTFQPDFHRHPMPDASRPVYNPTYNFEPQTSMYETPKASDAPFLVRRQRPIVGRKIIPSETPTERVQVPKIPEEEFLTTFWQDEPVFLQHTPPNVHNVYINNTNVFYELFPNENKGYEFKTPVKSSPTLSNMSNASPTLSNISPSRSPMGPMLFPQRSPSTYASSSKYSSESGQKMCTFCRKNGETPIVYMTHSVKEKVGNKYVVSCPILRSHICSTCGESGDNAHTITYCPVLRSNNNGQPLQSTTVTLKNTRIKSNGRRRY
ncbi:nanos RNA binding domain-containing protein [Phthorimaea operculella]|nr:nanos RNA binding domain-containing protein [Phthorimaea operculella]